MTSSLQELSIYGCDSLPASPFGEGIFLPATLKRLQISSCKGVESLAELNVEPLQSLQEIRIGRCEKLRSLPRGLHTVSHLTSLTLAFCPALELECFPPLPPAISSFRLLGCPKIKALHHQLHRLTCLRDLYIANCESITRFPEGGLPPQLQHLSMRACENMKPPVREWDWLPHLTSLESLEIDGRVGGVGKEEDLLLPLPSSLLHLYIFHMKKVKRLSTCLPPSLRSLDISHCPKLRELPLDVDDGLPPSLEHLRICNCEILKERFTKRTGCYRHLLREIPFIEIDYSELRVSLTPTKSIEKLRYFFHIALLLFSYSFFFFATLSPLPSKCFTAPSALSHHRRRPSSVSPAAACLHLRNLGLDLSVWVLSSGASRRRR